MQQWDCDENDTSDFILNKLKNRINNTSHKDNSDWKKNSGFNNTRKPSYTNQDSVKESGKKCRYRRFDAQWYS